MNQKPIKTALITHSISHFEVPFYRALARAPKIDFDVIYWDKGGIEEKFDKLYGKPIKWGIPLLDGYKNYFIPNIKELLKMLWEKRFDVVILYGYAGWQKILTAIFCRLTGTRLIFRGTATLLEKQAFPKKIIKKIILFVFFRLFNAFLVGGKYNREYFIHYDVKEEQTFFVPFTIDMQRFKKLAQEYIPQKIKIRKKMGISEKNVILFIGNLIPKKGPMILLKAFSLFVKKNNDTRLIVVGEGALKKEMEVFASTNKIKNKITFLGFLNQQQVPEAYAITDFAVFPSQSNETWARAINEAMVFGLPIIASKKVGAIGDIVKDKINGFVIEENNVNGFAEVMGKLVVDSNLREKMSEASKKIINHWTYEDNIQNAVQAIEYSLK